MGTHAGLQICKTAITFLGNLKEDWVMEYMTFLALNQESLKFSCGLCGKISTVHVFCSCVL